MPLPNDRCAACRQRWSDHKKGRCDGGKGPSAFVPVPRRPMFQSFEDDEIKAAAQLFKALCLGYDVRVMMRQRSVGSFFNKVNEMKRRVDQRDLREVRRESKKHVGGNQ